MSKNPPPNSCPYRTLPDGSYWRKSIENICPDDVDPINEPLLKIAPQDKIATAGSCFAQNISRYLQKSGFNYYVTETAHPILDGDIAEAFNYGTFSARYGNIYTSRQLLQLIQRAYGKFIPYDQIWREEERYIDPYRPFIQPSGFSSENEFRIQQEQHFASVRQLFERLDYFIFTLGLTELWVNSTDGAAYPVCPGCGAGEHDPDAHIFVNLTVDDVVNDLELFLALLKSVNLNAKTILTVSPVPLIATYEPKHILTATTYSKSVLRVCCETISNKYENVHYFPSFEIITGNFNSGAYYKSDFRNASEMGIDHVMRCFFTNLTTQPQKSSMFKNSTRNVCQDDITILRDADMNVNSSVQIKTSEKAFNSMSQILSNIVCDEENLDDQN